MSSTSRHERVTVMASARAQRSPSENLIEKRSPPRRRRPNAQQKKIGRDPKGARSAGPRALARRSAAEPERKLGDLDAETQTR